MKIALIPSAYAPAVGGVEVLTARLAHHLIRRGHSVEIWTSRSRGDLLPVDETIDGVRVLRFVFAMPRAAPSALLQFPRAATATLRRLRSATRDFRPDVLHVQCFSGNGAYATALSHMTGTPLVVTLQGETMMDDHDIYDHSAVLRLALRRGLRHATAVTGCSEFVLADARDRFGLDMRKAEVIFNGVDVDETAPTPVVLPFDRFVLGVGRVVIKKGFDLLLDAFEQVKDSHPSVGLVVAGDGAERGALQRRADELGLTARTRFLGRLDRGEVAAVMEAADVLVVPSRVEPFGMVVIEGWRAGVPAIVTSRGGPPEFVQEGVNGVVVDPNDTALLAASLDSLLRSPGSRLKLSEGGTSTLPDFAWSRLTGCYEAIYDGTVASGRARAASRRFRLR